MLKTLYKVLKEAVKKWYNHNMNEYKDECLLNCFGCKLSEEEAEDLSNYINAVKNLQAARDRLEMRYKNKERDFGKKGEKRFRNKSN